MQHRGRREGKRSWSSRKTCTRSSAPAQIRERARAAHLGARRGHRPRLDAGGRRHPVHRGLARCRAAGKLILTGQLGEVMKESAQAALTLAQDLHRRRAREDRHPRPRAGGRDAQGRAERGRGDVPRAGFAAVTGKPVRPDVAMTGEISLRGLVLPIGGVKEKTLAALRAGIKHRDAAQAQREGPRGRARRRRVRSWSSCSSTASRTRSGRRSASCRPASGRRRSSLLGSGPQRQAVQQLEDRAPPRIAPREHHRRHLVDPQRRSPRTSGPGEACRRGGGAAWACALNSRPAAPGNPSRAAASPRPRKIAVRIRDIPTCAVWRLPSFSCWPAARRAR